MAAQTPVTIESSPLLDAYPAPSITPDSLRRSVSTNSVTRSSPQLLSPSSFVRPRPQPLKNGSRVQQLPAGAHAGFASATSLWKEQAKNGDVRVHHATDNGDGAIEGHERQAEGSKPVTRSAGKLRKPRNVPKSRKTSLTADSGPGSPRYDSFLGSKGDALPLPGSGPPSNATGSRRPSINFSEYSFNADAPTALPPLPTGDVLPNKKAVRKRATKSPATRDVQVNKKSKKCKAKSEAIILDSDEPEEAHIDAGTTSLPRSALESEVATDGLHVSKTKQSKPSKTKSKGVTASTVTATKDVKSNNGSVKTSTGKSTYLNQETPALDQSILAIPPPAEIHAPEAQPEILKPPDEMVTEVTSANTSLPPIEAAPRRRRSRTPVTDSLVANTLNKLPVIDQELDEHIETVPFSELLGNFNYLQPDAVPIQRIHSGEATVKRRRIDLSNHSAVAQPQVSDATTATIAPKVAKSAKKPKAVLKKPQTVTALALAAYQPPKEPDPVQSTVSTYFAPQKDVEKAPTEEASADGQEAVANVKKPRKSRAKKPVADGEVVPAKKPAKPRIKTTKVKVKFDQAEYQAPLYSPTQACKQMKAQDFVFGTSSQLAADEPAEFVRDMQLALHQSEIACALPSNSQMGTQLGLATSNEDKSCAKVPTAPHGTCLSVEQADRELWCVSARDSTGFKLAHEKSLPLPDILEAADDEPIVRAIDIITLSSSGRETHENSKVGVLSPPESRTMAPLSNNGTSQALDDTHISIDTSLRVAEHDRSAVAEDDSAPPGEDWTYLRSDDSITVPQTTRRNSPQQTHRVATSPARRTVLQPLDANIPTAAPDFPNKLITKPPSHSFFTTATLSDKGRHRVHLSAAESVASSVIVPSPKRGRGRPRKDSLPERTVRTSPTRGRGRPRKNSLVHETAKTSPAKSHGQFLTNISTDRPGSTSPKRHVGRPRKEVNTEIVTSIPSKQSLGSNSTEDTTASLDSTSPKRPVGRPRKIDIIELGSSPPPTEPADRPQTGVAVARTKSVSPTPPMRPQSVTSEVMHAVMTSAKRSVGRPRNGATSPVMSPRAFRGTRPSQPPSASQPASRTDWTRIDEISDSETPPTPSPRRRRASSSPAFVRPLDFDLAIPVSATPAVAVSGHAAIKASDAGWPAIQTQIFPQIADTIKTAPLGKDMSTPSWHEKILLYDPIVLEDLTVWLNEQGLRYEVERLKHKTKAKGRRKKDAPPDVDEWEVVRDKLKPWMVQKWCEDNSVCCLWREGLRGGVKARY